MQARHLQHKHPFNAIVAGPTGSGKTFFVRNFLAQWDCHIYGLRKKVLNVVWCHGISQAIHNIPIGPKVKETYIDGLVTLEEINELKPDLIVIDDLMSETTSSSDLTNLFTRVSHHKSISIMFLVQNFYHQGKEMRTISLNAHYITLFKNRRDEQQANTLGRQMFPRRSKYFDEAYDDATKDSYGYISIDLSPTTPEKYRVRTRILAQEIKNLNYRSKIAPQVYYPRF